MKKENKFSKLFANDNILREKIYFAGFSTFLITSILGLIKIAGDLINGLKTFSQVEYTLELIVGNLLLFVGVLLYSTKARKKHLNTITCLIVSIIITALSSFSLYNHYQKINLEFIITLLLAFIIVNFIIKKLFISLKSDIDNINPSDEDD
jgi:ABC-type uncharacterized transport system permease subunit